MTLKTLQEHELHYLPFFQDDYRRKSLEELAKRYISGRRVLEMRCLTGHLAVDLALRGYEVTALDGLAEAVKMANTYGRSRGLARDIARAWDLEHLVATVDGSQFDTVLCLDTLNHVHDDQAMIAQIAQVMAEGGRLILNGPAFPALHGKRDAALGHLRRYTRRQFRALIERHGFHIALMRPWNFTALPMYVFIERVFRMDVVDRLRHGRRGSINRVANRLLRWWYTSVENRLVFPCGLTLFVIASKRSGP